MNYALSLYIAEHARLVPKTEELSIANQNRVLRHPKRQPIRIEHPSRHYVTRELSARVGDPSRLDSARYSLS